MPEHVQSSKLPNTIRKPPSHRKNLSSRRHLHHLQMASQRIYFKKPPPNRTPGVSPISNLRKKVRSPKPTLMWIQWKGFDLAHWPHPQRHFQQLVKRKKTRDPPTASSNLFTWLIAACRSFSFKLHPLQQESARKLFINQRPSGQILSKCSALEDVGK